MATHREEQEEQMRAEIDAEQISKEEKTYQRIKRASIASIARTFLAELKAEDPDDFKILDMRLAALAEELGDEDLTLKELDAFLRMEKDVDERTEAKS